MNTFLFQNIKIHSPDSIEEIQSILFKLLTKQTCSKWGG